MRRWPMNRTNSVDVDEFAVAEEEELIFTVEDIEELDEDDEFWLLDDEFDDGFDRFLS